MLRTSRAGLVAVYAVLGIWTLVTLFPIYWTLITSVKTPDAVYRWRFTTSPGHGQDSVETAPSEGTSRAF